MIRETCTRFHIENESTTDFVCECGCYTRIALTVAEYDARTSSLFASGHPARPRGTAPIKSGLEHVLRIGEWDGSVRGVIADLTDRITRRTGKAHSQNPAADGSRQ